jgi:hypothetical protein
MAGRNQLRSISLNAPGFMGITTNKAMQETGWALEADNCVIDGAGRLAARKGWAQAHSTALGSTPDIEQLHEYINGSGVSKIIAAAAQKLYSVSTSTLAEGGGATSLTEITGSLTITDDNWSFANIGGNMVGFQDSHAPIWWDGTGNGETLQSQISDWAATTDYSLGDIVKATGGASATLYFECTADSGSSGGSEPTWDTTAGNTTADSGITWTTRTFPVGDTVISAYGRIWTTDANKTTVHYSDLLLPYHFGTGLGAHTGGSIDMTAVWVYGMDEIVAVEEFNGYLLIFGKNNITIYNSPDDPANLAIQDTIVGTGCISKHSIQNIGTDILFLSNHGVRSLRKTIQEKSHPMNDISKNVRDAIVDYASAGDMDLLRSVYHEREGFYVLSFTDQDKDYVFDIRQPLPDGSFRATTWSSINPKAWCSASTGDLFMGQAGYIGRYDTYLDDTASYNLTYLSPWMTMGEHRFKFPKSLHSIVEGGNNYTLTASVAYDYSTAVKTVQNTISTLDSPAEYNVAEYSGDPAQLPTPVAEYSGGSAQIEMKQKLRGHGHTVQIGLSTTIDTNSINFQSIELHTVMGRLD